MISFYSPSLGELDLPDVAARIHEYIGCSPEYRHKIIIGTDSAPPIDGRVELISAIVVHRVGNGGIYFWRRTTKDKIQTLRDRMYQEALASIDLAQILMKTESFAPIIGSQDTLEVHIDVGERGPTREMIREIVGMVTGHGFQVRTKPQSFGASKVADRHT